MFADCHCASMLHILSLHFKIFSSSKAKIAEFELYYLCVNENVTMYWTKNFSCPEFISWERHFYIYLIMNYKCVKQRIIKFLFNASCCLNFLLFSTYSISISSSILIPPEGAVIKLNILLLISNVLLNQNSRSVNKTQIAGEIALKYGRK